MSLDNIAVYSIRSAIRWGAQFLGISIIIASIILAIALGSCSIELG